MSRELESLKTPPHSLEAEQSVIGGLMLDNKAWERVGDKLVADDFYRRDHRLIFDAIGELAERNQPCDAVTVSEFLDRKGQIEEAGGLAYLGQLAMDTPSAANTVAYAEIVRARSMLRASTISGCQTARASKPDHFRPTRCVCTNKEVT